MKSIPPLIVFALFSLNAFGEVYECKEHPTGSDDRKFSAVIDVERNEYGIDATLTSLVLNEPWPLNEDCDEPKNNVSLAGNQEDIEIKLGLKDGKECGFTLYIPTSGTDPALLAPRKSYKVYGEKPYLASCRAIAQDN